MLSVKDPNTWLNRDPGPYGTKSKKTARERLWECIAKHSCRKAMSIFIMPDKWRYEIDEVLSHFEDVTRLFLGGVNRVSKKCGANSQHLSVLRMEAEALKKPIPPEQNVHAAWLSEGMKYWSEQGVRFGVVHFDFNGFLDSKKVAPQMEKAFDTPACSELQYAAVTILAQRDTSEPESSTSAIGTGSVGALYESFSHRDKNRVRQVAKVVKSGLGLKDKEARLVGLGRYTNRKEDTKQGGARSSTLLWTVFQINREEPK